MSNIDGKPFTEILKLAAIGEAVVIAVRESELLKPKRRKARQARTPEPELLLGRTVGTQLKRRAGRSLAQVPDGPNGPDRPEDDNNAA